MQNVQGQKKNTAELCYNIMKCTEYFVLHKWVFFVTEECNVKELNDTTE
jgi:hypothetical protein